MEEKSGSSTKIVSLLKIGGGGGFPEGKSLCVFGIVFSHLKLVNHKELNC